VPASAPMPVATSVVPLGLQLTDAAKRYSLYDVCLSCALSHTYAFCVVLWFSLTQSERRDAQIIAAGLSHTPSILHGRLC
jgi:hypothetical protein